MPFDRSALGRVHTVRSRNVKNKASEPAIRPVCGVVEGNPHPMPQNPFAGQIDGKNRPNRAVLILQIIESILFNIE